MIGFRSKVTEVKRDREYGRILWTIFSARKSFSNARSIRSMSLLGHREGEIEESSDQQRTESPEMTH